MRGGGPAHAVEEPAPSRGCSWTDQLGHSRVSMTPDVYVGRRSVHQSVAAALDTFDPDRVVVLPVGPESAP